MKTAKESENGWATWGKHVLAELERLSGNVDNVASATMSLRTEVQLISERVQGLSEGIVKNTQAQEGFERSRVELSNQVLSLQDEVKKISECNTEIIRSVVRGVAYIVTMGAVAVGAWLWKLYIAHANIIR